MPRKFEDPDIRTNRKLQVCRVEPSDEESMKEVSDLIRTWNQVRKDFIYLDYLGSQYYFLGRFPEIDGIVGFVSLRSYYESPMYGVSMLTHPHLEDQGIATTLTKSAVDLAYPLQKIKGLFAHVEEHSKSETIIQRLGFRPHSQSRMQDLITYHLDTTEREPLISYNNLEGIESGLITILRDLIAPNYEVPIFLNRVNWGSSVLASSLTFGENLLLKTQEQVEDVLSQHFKDSFIHPKIPDDMKLRTFDIEATIRCVEPTILGPRHRLALKRQKVYYNKSGAVTQLAVIRPFEKERDLFTVSLYEIEHTS
jgi:hypothetical protein